MNFILKLFSAETLISFVVELLSSRVKNPGSEKAYRLRAFVRKLHDASEQFLAETDPGRRI